MQYCTKMGFVRIKGGRRGRDSKFARYLEDKTSLHQHLKTQNVLVPSGEVLTYGDDSFVQFEEVGIKETQKAAFVLVAGSLRGMSWVQWNKGRTHEDFMWLVDTVVQAAPVVDTMVLVVAVVNTVVLVAAVA
ncbi:hypothetical protein FXO38_31726 [Capsicum annuum]|nr:hypothetical protein FXO38_31726 [Capsicum annuum]KAF3628467.1 hypothetical protein FXO37_29359 [Capsicum annuum]